VSLQSKPGAGTIVAFNADQKSSGTVFHCRIEQLWLKKSAANHKPASLYLRARQQSISCSIKSACLGMVEIYGEEKLKTYVSRHPRINWVSSGIDWFDILSVSFGI
jgi:hypothetical protein